MYVKQNKYPMPIPNRPLCILISISRVIPSIIAMPDNPL